MPTALSSRTSRTSRTALLKCKGLSFILIQFNCVYFFILSKYATIPPGAIVGNSVGQFLELLEEANLRKNKKGIAKYRKKIFH
jgi:hypothetical protein